MNEMLNLLGASAFRAPKKALAVAFLVLVAFSASVTYSGSLVVGVVGDYLDISRFLAGLLLAILFMRLPSVRNGKLQSVGLLPSSARQPVMIGLLGFCLLTFLYRGQFIPVLFIGGVMTFVIAYKGLKQAVLNRMRRIFLEPAAAAGPVRSRNNRDDVIDVEFREKND